MTAVSRFRGVGLVVLLGTAGCAQIVGADFDNPRPRQPVVLQTGPPSQYLKATTPEREARFGYQVAMDDSGLLVSATFESERSLPKVGATYFFDLTKSAELPARIVVPYARAKDGALPDGLGFNYPLSLLGALRVAVSPDFIVIGLPTDSGAHAEAPPDEGAPASGAVYVYERADLDAPPQYIKSTHIEAGAVFGHSVALSGPWLAIGAPGETNPDAIGAPGETNADAPKKSGAIYVFERSGSRFEYSARLAPEIAHDGDGLGTSLALDRDLLVAGAPGERSKSTDIGGDPKDTSVEKAGAAYVFRRSSSDKWPLEAYVKPSKSIASGAFGTEVAASEGRIAIAAPGGFAACLDGPPGGATYVFGRTSGAWALERCFFPRSAAPVHFGVGLALHGSRLLVGAPWDPSGYAGNPTDTSKAYAGAAYVFDRDEQGVWHAGPYLKAPNLGENDLFGFSVSLAGGRMAVGAPQESGGGSGTDADLLDNSVPGAGAVYLYSE